MDDKALIEMQPENAAEDYVLWLEQLILGRKLTPQELEQISVKAQFWWAIASTQRDAWSRVYSRN